MTPDRASYKKSSFGPAFLFLEKRRREALAVYYAFCRLMDDLADEPGVKDPEKELTFWQEEITRAFAGRAQTDPGKELFEMAQTFGLEPDRFLLLIEGMRADVQGRTYATRQELEWYLWRVAGIVGLATLDILGVKGPQAQSLARQLGFAVQLTNIVRDVQEDARLGRVYLPQDLLAEHGLTREDILQNTHPEKLPAVLTPLAQTARDFYAQAAQTMRAFPARNMLPCRVMGCLYRANLAKIEKTGFVFARPVKLTKSEKLLHCIYALFQTVFTR